MPLFIALFLNYFPTWPNYFIIKKVIFTVTAYIFEKLIMFITQVYTTE